MSAVVKAAEFVKLGFNSLKAVGGTGGKAVVTSFKAPTVAALATTGGKSGKAVGKLAHRFGRAKIALKVGGKETVHAWNQLLPAEKLAAKTVAGVAAAGTYALT